MSAKDVVEKHGRRKTGRELRDHLLDLAERATTGAETQAPGEARDILMIIAFALTDADAEIERLCVAMGVDPDIGLASKSPGEA